jgi:hypothetical protein
MLFDFQTNPRQQVLRVNITPWVPCVPVPSGFDKPW